MKGTLLVSLDFELFWGLLEVYQLEDYRDHILGGRAAIPRMLELFEKYGVHATWDTVGFQFGRTAEEVRRFFPPEELRPTYANPKIRPYDYFDTLGNTEEEEPCFFAGSLVEQIAAVPGQEIGCHTLSHFYCREPGQTLEQFQADLKAARAMAQSKGITLKSLVMPRNECEPEYTQLLHDLGFIAYRDEENDWIHERIPWFPLIRLLRLVDAYVPLTGHGGYIPKQEAGVWNLTGTKMFRPILKQLPFLEGLKMRRLKSEMLYAAKNGLCFHLWWHPHNVGVDTDEYMRRLEELLRYYQELHEKYGMESKNMGELAEELNRAQNG